MYKYGFKKLVQLKELVRLLRFQKYVWNFISLCNTNVLFYLQINIDNISSRNISIIMANEVLISSSLCWVYAYFDNIGLNREHEGELFKCDRMLNSQWFSRTSVN
jgi:hypothetical protein